MKGFYRQEDVRRMLDELKEHTGLVRLSDAEFIIDVGFGVGNRDGYEAVIEPLERALRERFPTITRVIGHAEPRRARAGSSA